MAEEFFDIVDENNKELGIQKSRSFVHESKEYWHRTTHVWIINTQKEILCQKRSALKDVNPGEWQSFFGGHLKAGQSYEENAREELQDELGIDLSELVLQPLYILENSNMKHFGQVYLLEWSGDITKLH